ncbi:hypothetical protein L2E67_21030 [Planktothrix agardhii 1803]|uniref:hypothetical protein n=1 Tax=Planktothrix agardhii TaxID=1160 RepID=UPI001F3C2149|nr:hypothetical protein [Planktothrix agardhii]MCF3587556.1 hypothetical protein [Planktothrix agardhii 1803]
MISAKCLFCAYSFKFCQAQSSGERGKTSKLYNHLIISYNPQNLHRKSVDFGDAIATLTTNTTKPTGPSSLGGFGFVKNLLTNY